MASPTAFYKTLNLSQHFLFNQDKIKMEPTFYEDIHNYWFVLQGVEITKVDTILKAIHGTDVKNIHINRSNTTLPDQNGNVLDIRNVNFKTIYWIFVYQKIKTAIMY